MYFSSNIDHMFGHLILGTIFLLGGVPYAQIITNRIFRSQPDLFKIYRRSSREKLSGVEKGYAYTKDDGIEEESVLLYEAYDSSKSLKRGDDDRQMAIYACFGLCLTVGAAVFEGVSGLADQGNFFLQYEHMTLSISFMPFFICLLFESGKVHCLKDLAAVSPVPHQFFLALALYANGLLWTCHLKMKKPGWDYDGHEVFVRLNQFAYGVCILVVLSFAAGQRKLGAILLMVTPATAFIMNGVWLYVHAIVLLVFNVADTKSVVHDAAYPLYVVALFVVSIIYLAFLRRLVLIKDIKGVQVVI